MVLMVDKSLPQLERPLRWIFLDLNSYFASVEQAETPELRGKAMAVAPAFGDGGTIIAASYEAKKFGVYTGHKVREARELCPHIEIVPARQKLYVHYHQKILEAVDTVLPVDKVCSIDEMRFRLLGEERIPENAVAIAKDLKAAITSMVSPVMTSSIGIAPNPFLAKLATEFQKPDGLVVIRSEDLPHALDGRKLTVFPGINRRMEARLIAHRIFRSDDMVRAEKSELRQAFGSKVGEAWYHLLRGEELKEDLRPRKSLGHSNVLAPEFRNQSGAREILIRLIHKAAARLRGEGLYAKSANLYVDDAGRFWQMNFRLPSTQDAVLITQRCMEFWETETFKKPLKVGITFHDLSTQPESTPSLFDEGRTHEEHGKAVDHLNHKFGKNTVFIASTANTKDHATEKIAFQKTELFVEGKGDQQWKPGDKADDKL